MIRNNFFHILLAFSIVAILSFASTSCKNSIQEIREVTQKDTLPVQTAYDVELLYSENGIVRYKVLGTKVEQYEMGQPYTEFTDGLEVLFFDSLGEVQSKLTADYGVNWEGKREMEAKYNVVVISYSKDEEMYTEHLIWDQNKKKIFTEEFVTIVTKDKTLYGEHGMVSDEKFEKWELKGSRGKFRVEEEKE